MKNNSRPKIIATSVVGARHAQLGMHCQDHYKSVTGKNLVSVVSDGAGSAKHGKTGAKIVCETLCNLLKDVKFCDAPKQINKAIKLARERLIFHKLNKSKSEHELVNFAATVVGVLYHKGKGVFFHIGDGAAIAFANDYNKFFVSRPENGTFSCETFFYTQNDWAENLRLTYFGDVRTIFLMSDGVTSFSFNHDFRDIEQGFITPIDTFLNNCTNKNKAIKALANTLNAPKAQKINTDDKTLVWIKVK